MPSIRAHGFESVDCPADDDREPVLVCRAFGFCLLLACPATLVDVECAKEGFALK